MIHHFYLTVTIVRLESEKVRERMLGCATELDLDQLKNLTTVLTVSRNGMSNRDEVSTADEGNERELSVVTK
jgi:hypothetical protein